MTALAAALDAHIDHAGYHPRVVRASLWPAIGRASLRSFVVLPETTFEGSEIVRHLTVAVLTDRHLVFSHFDDGWTEDERPQPVVATTTERVAYDRIRTTSLSLVWPVGHGGQEADSPLEVVIGANWGGRRALDVAPAACSDPNCEADHGYTGWNDPADLSLRVTEQAEGPDAVQRALEFHRLLAVAVDE